MPTKKNSIRSLRYAARHPTSNIQHPIFNIEHLTSNIEHWDEIIEPRHRLLDLRLREVWRYRDLLWLFVKRDFAAQYRQTVLGPLWHLIQPIFTTAVFILVFSKIAGIDTEGVEPILFYMSGITLWNYFSSCLTATSSTFISNAAIFGKVYFPRLVLPLSTVVSNIIKFGIQFGLLLAVMIFFGVTEGKFHFGLSWLLIPVLVLMMAGMGLGAGIIISSLTTKYRDFTVLVGFAVQLLLYATPVAYPLSYLKGINWTWVVRYNPLTPIMEAFRYALFEVGSYNPVHLCYSGLFIIAVLFAGALLFNKVEKNFMDTV